MPPSDASFERAYTQYLPAVSGYLFRRVERQHVEDLAADVFAIAWRKRASVAEGEELPWLYRIAANVVANHRRKQANGTSLLAALRPADSAPSAEEEWNSPLRCPTVKFVLENRPLRRLRHASCAPLKVAPVKSAFDMSRPRKRRAAMSSPV